MDFIYYSATAITGNSVTYLGPYQTSMMELFSENS